MKFSEFTMNEKENNRGYLFLCPGCGFSHYVPTDPNFKHKPGPWIFNGDIQKPTLSPSIKVTYGKEVCHSFITAGKIRFCGDSTHELAGQIVELPEWD